MPVWIAALVGVALLGNLAGLLGIGLLPDEAYYWVWSQRPQWGYFDHPPLIAWLMLPGAWLFNDAAWAVRLPAVASWLVGAVVGYRMAQQIFGGTAGALALMVWASLPIMQVGFHVVTPDNALIIFTWLGLWAAWRAGQEPGARWWLLTGSCIGLALLAKYPAVLLMGALFFALLSSQDGRRWLVTPWPWLGCLLALILFMPVVFWNGTHDWVSFRFQFGHGVKASTDNNLLAMFMLFLGGQLVVAMPWSYFAMMWAPFSRVGRSLDGYTRALLSWNFFLPMSVFGIAGLTASSGPNWPVSAYAAGTLLLAGLLNDLLYRDGKPRQARAWFIIGLFLLPHLLLNIMRFPHLVVELAGDKLPPQRTQLTNSYGWEPVATVLREQLSVMDNSDTCHILTGYHGRAGMIAWMLRLPDRVDATMSARVSQYTLWRNEVEQEPDYCLYLQQYDSRSVSNKNMIPTVRELPEGVFEILRVIEVKNPDGSKRWFGIYRAAST
ncbi:MAG: glycosyltransferase family 39 protein [Pseudomonadota bacterium]